MADTPYGYTLCVNEKQVFFTLREAVPPWRDWWP